MKVWSVSKTSLTGTPSAFAFDAVEVDEDLRHVRPEGREEVARAPGEPFARVDRPAAPRRRARSSRPPTRSWSWNSKPPVRERPRIGAGFSAKTRAPGIARELRAHRGEDRLERLPSRRARPTARASRRPSRRSAGEVPGQRVEAAEQVDADDARRPEQDRSRPPSRRSSVRSSDGAVRELEAGDEVALVLVGHEAGRHRAEEQQRRDAEHGEARRAPRARRGSSARTPRS